MDDRLRAGGEHGGRHGRRPGREEVLLLHALSVAAQVGRERPARGSDTIRMDVLLSFAAALVSLRLAGLLSVGGGTRGPAGSLSFAAAAAAMAWGVGPRLGRLRLPRVLPRRGAPLGPAPRHRVAAAACAGAGRTPVGLLWSGVAIGLASALHVHGTFAGTRRAPRAGSPRRAAARRSRSRRARSARRRSSPSRRSRCGGGRSGTCCCSPRSPPPRPRRRSRRPRSQRPPRACACRRLYAARGGRSRVVSRRLRRAGRSAELGLEQALEERAVPLERHPEILRRDVAAARPLPLELRARLVEALREVAQQLGDERVGVP